MVREQAIALSKCGHNVTLIVREPSTGAEHRISMDGINEYRYRVNRSCAAAFVLTSLINTVKTFNRILDAGFMPDVVIIDQSLPGIGPILFRKNKATLWIYQCFSLAHEEYITRNTASGGILSRFSYFLHTMARRLIESWTLQLADRVIVMSQFMRERVISCHAIPDTRISLVPGAADVSRFKPSLDRKSIRAKLNLPDNKIILLTVRNLVPRMGLENLLKAISELGKEKEEIHLLIGGNGPLRSSLEQLSLTLNLDQTVSFKGFIPETELSAYYQAADLFVLPTRILEGFGLVTVEALACGTPVLGTPIGATPEILGQIDTRLLASSYDSRALADALRRLLCIIKNSPDEWDTIARKCRELAANIYTWKKNVEQIEKIILAQHERASS